MSKKYQIIYADPPWKYNDRRNKHTRMCGGAMAHYPVMDYNDIAKLSVNKITDENCALFLWATFPCLKEAIFVMEAWGFKYKTIAFNWIKTNQRQNVKQYSFLPCEPDPFFGIGYYTKSNSEICLLGIRGKMKPISNKVSSVVISPRREHSRKPDEVKEKIVELFGDLPRIELFARRSPGNWDVWGNEVESDIKL